MQSRFPWASLGPTQHFSRSTDCLLAWFDENFEMDEVDKHILQEQQAYPTSPRFWTGSLPGVADGQARSAS